MLAPFTWDARAGQYRDASGRFVARSAIRSALDNALNRAQARMMDRSQQLADAEISLETWREQMAADLKSVHLYSSALARGGWAQMTQADYGRVGRTLRDQYRYLNNLTVGIGDGTVKLDGRFFARVKLYVQSGRVSYHAMDDALAADRGMTEERNILHAAEHCDDCLEQTALGWVPLGDLTPIGLRTCLSNDKCTKEFR